ncbi:hypothetical protein MLD38_025964 [Melastoma candidum]|uniref:Uncharacterized protein n=1 Tax=Melastoma candidum TaxID=119954 RepID=A0ACB9NXI3_9MYRT|nr:hypothetical protein MLD38_025964 [Melastoma candidum]
MASALSSSLLPPHSALCFTDILRNDTRRFRIPKSLLALSPSACCGARFRPTLLNHRGLPPFHDGLGQRVQMRTWPQPEKRRAEAARIREKYPDKILVIVEKAERSDIPNIDKKKYLVTADLTVGQFIYVLCKQIKLSAEKAIFIYVLPLTGAIMSTIYEDKKDKDGFLYVTYNSENTFGS